MGSLTLGQVREVVVFSFRTRYLWEHVPHDAPCGGGHVMPLGLVETQHHPTGCTCEFCK